MQTTTVRYSFLRATFLLVLAATAGPFATRGFAQADSQPTFTGNWSGLRPVLGRLGLTVAGSYTSDWSGVAAGGVRRDALGRGLLNVALSADLGALAGPEEFRFALKEALEDEEVDAAIVMFLCWNPIGEAKVDPSDA